MADVLQLINEVEHGDFNALASVLRLFLTRISGILIVGNNILVIGNDFLTSGADILISGEMDYPTETIVEQSRDAVSQSFISSPSINLLYDNITPSITAEAVFGSVANTVAEGNHTHPQLHNAVTVTGQNYITLAGQQITANQVNLSTNVAGNISVANMNNGENAHSGTYWRGDGVWVTPNAVNEVQQSFLATVTQLGNSYTITPLAEGTVTFNSDVIFNGNITITDGVNSFTLTPTVGLVTA